MPKTRLMVVCPDQNDATSFYRGMGPLVSLAKKHDDLELINALDPTWTALKYVDMVFLQRPHVPECVQLLKKANRMGVPVWVDYDDWLLGLPHSNPVKSIYHRKDIQQNIKDCLAGAHVVTVSTPALAKLVEPFTEYAPIVIPNAWDSQVFTMNADKPYPGRVAWRGSATHDEDLMSILLSLQHFADKADWHLIGDPFWLACQTLGKYKRYPWQGDVIDYFDALKRIAPSVLIAPLVDSPFNRAKSNIAWIEATVAGAVTVAPDFDEWRKPGCFTYTNNFRDILQQALLCDTVEINKQAREYLADTLRLERTNKLREEILFR